MLGPFAVTELGVHQKVEELALITVVSRNLGLMTLEGATSLGLAHQVRPRQRITQARLAAVTTAPFSSTGFGNRMAAQPAKLSSSGKRKGVTDPAAK